MINDRPAYFCERTVDGEKQKFGIKFDLKQSLTCGEFHDEEANGPAYRLYLEDEYEKKSFCGPFVNGIINGLANWYFFDNPGLEIGNAVVRESFQ